MRSILIIDTNTVLLKYVTRVLEGNNLQITVAPSPEEGLRLLQECRGAFDVVVSSLRFRLGFDSMGYLSQLLKLRSKASLIVTSGAWPEAEEQRWLEEHNVPFLAKPYNAGELLRLVAPELAAHAKFPAAPGAAGAPGAPEKGA